MREGDVLSIDGSTGEVFLGAVPVSPSPVVRYFEGTMSVDEGGPVVAAVDRLMSDADKHRRMQVRANADNAPGRRPGPPVRRRGHRPVPHRAHVPR